MIRVFFSADCLGTDFRMQFTREEWEQERLGWRAIIQLNIVRQVLYITQILESELCHDSVPSSKDGHGQTAVDAVQNSITALNTTENAPNISLPLANTQRPEFTDQHRHLATRLSSQLSKVEQKLRSRLTPHDVHYPAVEVPLSSATPFEVAKELDDDMLIRRKNTEYSSKSWRDLLYSTPQTRPSTDIPTGSGNLKPMEHLDIPTQVLANLRGEIKALWADEAVRKAVRRRRLEIPDSIGL
jgi:guanine nucleotide-binding protein subunit alpha